MDEPSPSPSMERRLDAEEIEAMLAHAHRPTARMQVEALIKKLRKESEALERVEASKANLENRAPEVFSVKDPTLDAEISAPDVEIKPPSEENVTAQPARAAGARPVSAPVSIGLKFVPIDRFSFDAGQYNSSHVTVYVPLPGVGSISRDLITCEFTNSSFDLIVKDLNGKSYRLFKDELEKDIVKEECKYIVKADKVIIKLGKKKSEYGSYDYWSKLSDPKKGKKLSDGKKDDPSASIMEMMKEMYDSGDDKMKKMIGETMLKQHRGELDRELGKGMGGMGGMGGLDDMDDI